MPLARGLMVAAALLGAAGVVIAALGAHLSGGAPDPGGREAWHSALLIHFTHVGALIGVGLAVARFGGRAWPLAGVLMVLGVVLFSGSLYRMRFLELDAAGPTAPLGGGLLILAWLVAAFAAWRSRE
jgi:uncharacterized membrane protein YgdD (TMEM256/DUF423 family)